MSAYIIFTLTFSYLYIGFFIAMKDVERYNFLDDLREKGGLITANEQVFLDSMDSMGGVNSSYFRKLVLIYMIIWLPLYLLNLRKKWNNYFMYSKSLKMKKYEYFMLVYKLGKSKFKCGFKEGQFYIDLWNIGLAFWRFKK